MQSVVSSASDPAEVLRGLNRILSGQLRSQFVSAAYLWLDTETRKALYSAAGHPPLLCWREGKLERIESNGLLIGVRPDSDYPVCEIPLNSGDRFLLYTDGIIEPENAAGDPFGDHQLEQVVRDNGSRPPSELSEQLLARNTPSGNLLLYPSRMTSRSLSSTLFSHAGIPALATLRQVSG